MSFLGSRFRRSVLHLLAAAVFAVIVGGAALAQPADSKVFTSSRSASSLQTGAAAPAAATLSGHIAHENGVFLEGVTVRLTGLNRSVVTDAQGYYFFDNVPNANFTLEPVKQGYQFYPPGVNYQGYVGNDVRNFSSSGPPPLPRPPAPGTPTLRWSNYYQNPVGGLVRDYTSMIGRDPNGNIYYAGSSMDRAEYGRTDFVLIKTDPNGNRLWSRRFDSDQHGNDNLHDMVVDGQGNIYLAGESYRGTTLDFDYTVLKYDSSGNLVWMRHFDGGSDQLTSMDLDPSGNVLVTGQSLRIGFTFDYLTLKYDPQGALLWQARFDGGQGDGGREVETDAQGNVYVTGTSSVIVSGATTDIVTIKYNSAGQQQWLNRYDSQISQGEERAHELEVDCQGNVYVMGNVDPNYVEDNIVFKINNAGVTQWIKIWSASGEAANELSSQIAADCSGNVYVTGITNIGNEINNNDAYLVKLDPSTGSTLWSRIYDEPFSGDYQGDNQLLIDPDGSVYLGTTSQHFFNYNLVIMKYSTAGNVVWKYKYDNPYFEYDAFADWRSDGSFAAMVMDPGGTIYFAGESTIPGQSMDMLAGKIATTPEARAAAFDFDGDRKADIAVFRPSTGDWHILNSGNGSYSGIHWGATNDAPAPADYDGDGRTDVGVFRDGQWHILLSSTGSYLPSTFGQAGDAPRPADYDNDGKADIAVFRGGDWFMLNSSDQSFNATHFGTSGDIAAVGDFDGDRSADIGVFRNGVWFVSYQPDLPMSTLQFGQAGDKVAAADFDGDGRLDRAVFRGGDWYIWQSSVSYMRAVHWGSPGDIPVPADYDGDGRADLAVFRNGDWHILRSSTNEYTGIHFGSAGDVPLPSAYLK